MKTLAKAFATLIVLSSSACRHNQGAPPTPPTSPPSAPTPTPVPGNLAVVDGLLDARESHLSQLRQLTFGGENAEAYWNFSGDALLFQTTRPGFACDQIMTLPLSGDAGAKLASTGRGRTTCSYSLPGTSDIIYASTHHQSESCPAPPDMSMGYVWALYDYEIYRSAPGDKNPTPLTDSPGYDAEATVCGRDGSIIFTSTRDGDLELYRMDSDGSHVTRLTHSPGYDGGAFFSADCSQIVWRASRPTGKALTDYQNLLEQNLVRPTQLEIWIANADGSNARQVTYLGAASFAPFLHPSQDRILFSSNYPEPRGREFNIWAINTDGTDLEQITFAEGFDGFPMFSPDGKTLAFSSNRRDTITNAAGAVTYRATGGPVGKTDTNVFLAAWTDKPTAPAPVTSRADRLKALVSVLADDALEGRGVGTKGLDEALTLAETNMRDRGLAPAADKAGQTYRQPFAVTTGYSVAESSQLEIDGVVIDRNQWTPLLQSANGRVVTPARRVGWARLGDGEKADFSAGHPGDIAIAHRFLPPPEAPAPNSSAPSPHSASAGSARQRSDFASKLMAARKYNYRALIIIDDGDPTQPEAPLPALEGRRSGGDAGLVAIVATRKVGDLLDKAKLVKLNVQLVPNQATTANLVGVVRAPRAKAPPIVVGAHLDHLGFGGESSLVKERAVHNGADDNASGVAVLLEVASALVAQKAKLDRDVYFVLFSGEEMGVLGSEHFVKQLGKTKLTAMINMDMVGRLRGNLLSVLGADSAPEWKALVQPLCEQAKVTCDIGGTGYGPSDHMPFYIAGAPVLHFFTGSHLDYHKPSDDAATLNYAGASAVSSIVEAAVLSLASGGAKLTYKKSKQPSQAGGFVAAASLGTVPSYVSDPTAPAGMLLSDVVPGGPADKAGLRAGDRIVKLDEIAIRGVEDLMAVLQIAKPGRNVRVTFLRQGKAMVLTATYGMPRNH